MDPHALAVACLAGLHVYSLVAPPPLALNVVATATSLVFLGASRSLKLLRKNAPPGATDEPREETLTLSARDAYTFPVVGSCALVGCYALIKIFGKDLLNALLLVYFVGLGLAAVEGALEGQCLAPKQTPRFGREVELPRVLAAFLGQRTLDSRVSGPQLACWAASAVLIAVYAATRHWLLNNLIAACLCVTGMELVSVGSFRTAAILLCGLFVYDITWVFGSDVMVTVAKGIDGPIKMLFRRALEPGDDADKPFSILGLGDIVVPGLFVALILRFDATRAAAPADARAGGFAAPTFRAVLAAYAAGLALTLWMMAVFDAAQPALLYLVPATLLAALGRGAAGGYLAELWAFSEEEEEAAAAPAPSNGSSNGATTPRRSPRLAAAAKKAS